jgi:hypothetical protein
MALLGWTASVLWTATRTAYRSRLDVKLLSFFHDVNFTLCSKRGESVGFNCIPPPPIHTRAQFCTLAALSRFQLHSDAFAALQDFLHYHKFQIQVALDTHLNLCGFKSPFFRSRCVQGGRLAQRRLASRSLLSTMFNNQFLAATVRTACGKVGSTITHFSVTAVCTHGVWQGSPFNGDSRVDNF